MKKFLVVFLALAMVLAFAATALAADTEIPNYTDMDSQKAEWQAAVYRLTALGVLEGNNGVGGEFRPADYITRAELAKMVVYLTGNSDKVSYYAAQAPAYTDVADGYWAEGYINAAKDLSLMKGVGYGKFNPTGTVTFQETATVVLRALGYTDALKGEWPADYSRKAAEIGLTDYVNYIGPMAITRAELSSIFNEALDKLMVSYISDSTAQGIGQIIGLTAAQLDWYGLDEDEGYYGVDADGFAYTIFYTNDDDRSENTDLLAYAFDATAKEVQFYDCEAGKAVTGKNFSEANAWGYDDFDEGELEVASYDFSEGDDADHYSPDDADVDLAVDDVASLYYIYGGGLADLADMQADVTYNDDGEVLFVQLTSQKIKVNEWSGDSEEYFCYADGNKVEIGDTKYKVNTDKGYQLNDDAINADAINAYGGYGYMFLDEDGNAYDFKDYYQFANAEYEVFDNVDDNYVHFVNGDAWRISKLPDYQILKDGAFVELADLEFGDVLYQAPLYDDDTMLYIALSPLTTSELTKAYTGSSYGFTADDVRYYGEEDFTFFSVTGGDKFDPYYDDTELRDEFFNGDAEVTYAPAYAFRNFVYASIDIEGSDYGVITDLDYKASTSTRNNLVGVTIMKADGTEATYNLDDEYDNTNPFFTNELIWTIGSFVEFQLDSDGNIITADSVYGPPEMWFRYDGDVADGLPMDHPAFTSRYDWTLYNTYIWGSPAPGPAGEVSVDEDDATITFDDETYDLADDAEIFVVSTDDFGAYDDCDIETAADLLADGDFYAWQIAACYTSGTYGTTIDTLWIVDQDLDNDIEMGYENGGKSYNSGDYYAKLNATADTLVSQSVYSNWNGGFIAYGLDGDTIDSSSEFITFEDGTFSDSLGKYTAPPQITIPDWDVVDDDYLIDTDYASTAGTVAAALFTNTDEPLSTFKLNDGSDDVYDITVGVLDGDPDISKGEIQLTYSWNGSNSDTYKYGTSSFVFFKDLDGNAVDEATDMDDLDAGDTVLIVRKGATILYAFRIIEAGLYTTMP